MRGRFCGGCLDSAGGFPRKESDVLLSALLEDSGMRRLKNSTEMAYLAANMYCEEPKCGSFRLCERNECE